MARGGQTKDRDDAIRKCIVTGDVQPKAGLVRFVVGPDNQVVPDILGKLPGRGMYVTADRAALDKAGKGQFARGAKQAVTVPDGLADEVERQLVRRVVDLIAMARELMWYADWPAHMARKVGDFSYGLMPDHYAHRLKLRDRQAKMDHNQQTKENYAVLSELVGKDVPLPSQD